MRNAVACVLAVGLLGCCAQRRVDLLLDLKTDFVPGVEFTAVQTERFSRIPTSEQTARGPAKTTSDAQRGDDFIRGKRIAVFRDLAPGRHAVRVRLLGPDGVPFLQRILLITLQRTSVFTVVMTRDCLNVTCPGSSDDPSATECLNGRCIRPECTPETPESCPSFSCDVGVTCVAAATCAEPRCTAEQVCLRAEGTGCSSAEYCDPELGCRPLPNPTADAGLPDADADASILPATFPMYLKASNSRLDSARSPAAFGTTIAMSSDGMTLAVGAPGENSASTGVNGDQSDDSATDSGAVYVFTRNGTTWSQQAYLKASNTDAFDQFGGSVALSADGSTLAVGAWFEDSAATGIDGNQTDNSALASGAVYVFTRNGTTWLQQAYLKPSNTGEGDLFGPVALSGDGSTLAVGAYLEDSTATGIDGDQADNSALESGAVYVFTRNGTTWSQQAYLKASNAGANDWFGGQVALSADGSTLGVSAPFEASAATGVDGDQADNSATASGAVYVFTRSGTTWLQQAYLKASNTQSFDLFGVSLAISSEGLVIAVGAIDEDSAATGIDGDQADNSATKSGAVYVFTRSGATWLQQAYLKASNAQRLDEFGRETALSADGLTLAVGTPGEDSAATGIDGNQADNSAADSGAIYIYVSTGSSWTQRTYLKAPNAEAGDAFGASIALSTDGLRMAASAPGEDSAARGIDGNQADNAAPASGAVYVYTF